MTQCHSPLFQVNWKSNHSQHHFCRLWPVVVKDITKKNRYEEITSNVKTRRWHETSRKMFKHFTRVGHGDRSSLRQSTQKECLPTMKCRRCQSVGEQDLSWQRPCHKVAPVCAQFSSCCFKQEQTAATVTDYMVQMTIVQIVRLSTWQIECTTRCWRNPSRMICLCGIEEVECNAAVLWLSRCRAQINQSWGSKINMWCCDYRKASIPIKQSLSGRRAFITHRPISICKSF